MGFKMFLVLLTLTMVVNYSGNCNAQEFICVLVPCSPSGKVSKQVCIRCIDREQGVALSITKHCYCIFCIWSFWSFNLYIIHCGVWFDNVVAFCHLSKVKFCARIQFQTSTSYLLYSQKYQLQMRTSLFFVPRDRQMIRLPLLTVTWSWRISNEEETGWGWQTFCGTTKGKTLTNLRTKTNNWSYLSVRGAMFSINSNRNVNFVETKLMDVVW